MIVYQLLVMKLTWECAYGIEVIANTLTYVTTISNIRLSIWFNSELTKRELIAMLYSWLVGSYFRTETVKD